MGERSNSHRPFKLRLGRLMGLAAGFGYGLVAGVSFAPIYNAFNVQGSD